MSCLLGAGPAVLLLAGSLDMGCSGTGREAASQRPTPSPSASATESPTPSPSAAASATPVAGPRSFAVYALSRGKGVPQEAWEVLQRVRGLVESDRKRGVGVKIERTPLGLEGETRLCAEYEDPRAAEKALARARDLAKGVDLLNVVVEPCRRRAPPTERKE